jgi:GWxTD domain-containing protein
LLFSNVLYSQTAQEYLKNGLALKQSGNIDGAIKMLEKAIGANHSYADAYFELGVLYQSKKTPGALKSAEEMFIAAKRYGKDDVQCFRALALLYEDRFMIPVAKTMWENVLKIDPKNKDALLGLARLYAKDADSERWRKVIRQGSETEDTKIEYDDKNIYEYVIKYGSELLTVKDLYNYRDEALDPLLYDKFVASKDSIAEMFNKKLLKLDPENRDALYQLGLLYFNKSVYKSCRGTNWRNPSGGYVQDSTYLPKFARLFEQLVEKRPDDKNGHLFLGLAYHRMHEYDKAFEEFITARDLMRVEERVVFNDISVLHQGALSDTSASISKGNPVQFWYQRDPVYLTPYNERELEHYARVAEANLRFSIPRKDIEGWKTVQGKLFIKYGPPQSKMVYSDVSTMDFQNNLWSYDKFSFVFEDMVMS